MTEEIKPLVSISCVTYNHAPFIRQCLDGFFIQKCDFDFEILLHDDASTDGSQEIVKEYMARYPGIIKPIFQIENQYSKGVRSMSMTFNAPRAKGKYIALCEGDDYWTDPLKLQKQVTVLQSLTDVSMVFHSAKVLGEDGFATNISLARKVEDRSYSGEEILNLWTVPTASVLFRKSCITNKTITRLLNKNYIYGDIILFLSLAECGHLMGISDIMSVYRRHGSGVLLMEAKIKGVNRNYINHHEEMSKDFNGKYKVLNHAYISNHYYLALNKNESLLKILKYLYYFNKHTFISSKKLFFSIYHLKVNIQCAITNIVQ